MDSSVSARLNADLLDEKYLSWRRDPGSVEKNWASFFEGFELGCAHLEQLEDEEAQAGGAAAAPEGGLDLAKRARIVSMVYNFRALGHTAAMIDPLSEEAPEQPRLELEEFGFTESDLDLQVATQFYLGGRTMALREMIARLRSTYCDRIGFEFMHIHDTEVRNWIRERIESRVETEHYTPDVKKKAMRWLVEAEGFEHFLHRRFVGQKRFSLEGGESLMVALNHTFELCPKMGLKEIVLGMAHRGRLNVLANFLRKSIKTLLYEFSENYVPNLVAGDGDVKYHLGFETRRSTENGDEVLILLAANPSHLEAVNAVVEGKARARQRIIGDTEERKAVLPLLIHGDAAFAGQGSVTEVLNLSQLPGYRTGGTLHIVINNQIGFTTSPEDARSSAYCTDVAKMIEAPVFHVNGDHPLEVMAATALALEFRQKFKRDVVIDLVCYRRHGHNEGDEPVFTQPKLYQTIQALPSAAEKFRAHLAETGVAGEGEIEALAQGYRERMDADFQEMKDSEEAGNGRALGGSTATPQSPYSHGVVRTAISREKLRELGVRLTTVPDDFRLNEKIRRRFVEPRRTAIEEGGPFNWGFAEALAFASLLAQGNPVRLSGQDSRRGTFSHRHSVFYDVETRERYIPLLHLSEDQARFCVYNSLLSEAAVLGFDYGYSLMVPEMLILWEAQFGDFANGAQVIIDQFIASAESKWMTPSGIVMLLPHGYEGQGPEHSSARLERFLQLCAGENMTVCNLTKPAQFFHLLRRQVMRPFRKPLILMTPKSLLTRPEAVSMEKDFIDGTHFHEVIDDGQLVASPERVTRLIFCSGKVYYDLLEFRNAHKLKNVALIRIEQIYPLHYDLLSEIVARYPRANKKWVWCQEEPENMGAWWHIHPRLERLSQKPVRYAGRERSASPSAGSKAMHVREQKQLVEQAFHV